jgi:hypothetical protein
MEEQERGKGLSSKSADAAGLHGGAEHAAHNAQVLPSPVRKGKEGKQVLVRGGVSICIIICELDKL